MEKILDDLLKHYGVDRILSHLISVGETNYKHHNEEYQKKLSDDLLIALEHYRGRYKEEETENVCRCGQPGEEEHTCPYAEDINGDSKTLCNCCSDCSYQCAMDIKFNMRAKSTCK